MLPFAHRFLSRQQRGKCTVSALQRIQVACRSNLRESKTPGLDGLYSKSFTALLVLFPIGILHSSVRQAFIDSRQLATALSAMTCILQTTIHFFGKTRGMKLDISSKEIRGIFYYNLFTLLLVLFAFVVQLAVLLVGRARVLYLSLENPRLRYHGENTVGQLSCAKCTCLFVIHRPQPWLSGFAVLCHLIDLCIINSWRKERLNSEKNKKAEKAAKKSKNKAVVEPSHDQDVVGKLEEIGKLDESEAVTPPQYHLDGYVLEKDDSSKEKHSTTL